MTLEFIPHTKRRKMTRARAAAIFLREQGRCYICSKKLRIGVDKYQIEHPEALCLGGSDDDADLRVVCDDCHKPKTKADAAAKADRDRAVTASWQRETPRPSRWQSRGFAPPRPRKNATSPVIHKSQRHEDTQ
jgi:5-methylcytosine-specific restriction endonuclease McrA